MGRPRNDTEIDVGHVVFRNHSNWTVVEGTWSPSNVVWDVDIGNTFPSDHHFKLCYDNDAMLQLADTLVRAVKKQGYRPRTCQQCGQRFADLRKYPKTTCQRCYEDRQAEIPKTEQAAKGGA